MVLQREPARVGDACACDALPATGWLAAPQRAHVRACMTRTRHLRCHTQRFAAAEQPAGREAHEAATAAAARAGGATCAPGRWVPEVGGEEARGRQHRAGKQQHVSA